MGAREGLFYDCGRLHSENGISTSAMQIKTEKCTGSMFELKICARKIFKIKVIEN